MNTETIKVYIVEGIDLLKDETDILGVFTTEEAAVNFATYQEDCCYISEHDLRV